jgi:hypothetical protein
MSYPVKKKPHWTNVIDLTASKKDLSRSFVGSRRGMRLLMKYGAMEKTTRRAKREQHLLVQASWLFYHEPGN